MYSSGVHSSTEMTSERRERGRPKLPFLARPLGLLLWAVTLAACSDSDGSATGASAPEGALVAPCAPWDGAAPEPSDVVWLDRAVVPPGRTVGIRWKEPFLSANAQPVECWDGTSWVGAWLAGC